MTIDAQTVSYLLGLSGLAAVLFSTYNYFRDPQISSDKEVIRLREDLNSLNKEVDEIKTKHLTSVEENIKNLSGAVHDLAINVTRLSTIIDERIPRTTK